MAGYKGYSMSNNAISAYENGERPFSKWTKEEIRKEILKNECTPGFSAAAFIKCPADLARKLFLYRSSYHHTSSFYNTTDFYSINFNMVEWMTDSELYKRILTYKEAKKGGKGKAGKTKRKILFV